MAKKVYLLSESMRSAKSGYYVEGTDISMDYPDVYPLPMETEVLEADGPVTLRWLPHCNFLEKEKQIKNGYPASYRHTQQDRDRIAFKYRRLELDDVRDKMAIEFLDRSPWKEGNEQNKTRDTTKTIFFEYDENVELDKDLADERLVTMARNIILDLDDSAVRNLYRLAIPGVKTDSMTLVKHMRKHLVGVCDTNPEFIIDGVKSSRDRLVVMIGRAIDAEVLSLEFPGQVAIYNKSAGEFQTLININDSGGPDDKFDRLVDYLQTEAGSGDMAIIEEKTREAEAAPEVVAEVATPRKSAARGRQR